jgi:hypothetical protein
LASFTESVTKTGSNLDELRTQHLAAIKAVEAENRKKVDDKKKGNGSKTTSTPPASPTGTAEFRDGKPVFGSKAAQPPVDSPGLFDIQTPADTKTEDVAREASTALQP